MNVRRCAPDTPDLGVGEQPFTPPGVATPVPMVKRMRAAGHKTQLTQRYNQKDDQAHGGTKDPHQAQGL